jgi:hypothetical protein
MQVGPSENQARWHHFFFDTKHWEPGYFKQLLESEPPGVAIFEVETYINGIYRSCVQMGADPQVVSFKARWVAANSEHVRSKLGWQQRDLNIELMRWMRKASCLSLVVGAGATMDAGGPSWAELVRRILTIALEKGHEITRMVPSAESTPEHRVVVSEVVERRHFDPEAEKHARRVLESIENKEADTEELMEGAQLCYDLFGQHLFTHFNGILYENGREPGPIHRAIADMGSPQLVPDRGGHFPGWDCIITYNFDDLTGEAFDDAGLARAAFAMRGDEIAGDPNQLAIEQGQEGLYQRIYHLHGYTPKKRFLITKVKFVFSTSQYQETYDAEHPAILEAVFERWLANPIHHALYVGCSFQDKAMNDLLEQAADRLPGRAHFALLQWSGDRPFSDSATEEIDLKSARFNLMGIRPIWFDEFEEIPGIIQRLA